MDWKNMLLILFGVATIVVMICCVTDRIDDKNRNNQAVSEYKSEGGLCYVDGKKQDDSFDINGVDLDDYTVTYKNGKLYLKSVQRKRNTTTFPVIIPIR